MRVYLSLSLIVLPAPARTACRLSVFLIIIGLIVTSGRKLHLEKSVWREYAFARSPAAVAFYDRSTAIPIWRVHADTRPRREAVRIIEVRLYLLGTCGILPPRMRMPRTHTFAAFILEVADQLIRLWSGIFNNKNYNNCVTHYSVRTCNSYSFSIYTLSFKAGELRREKYQSLQIAKWCLKYLNYSWKLFLYTYSFRYLILHDIMELVKS